MGNAYAVCESGPLYVDPGTTLTPDMIDADSYCEPCVGGTRPPSSITFVGGGWSAENESEFVQIKVICEFSGYGSEESTCGTVIHRLSSSQSPSSLSMQPSSKPSGILSDMPSASSPPSLSPSDFPSVLPSLSPSDSVSIAFMVVEIFFL